MIRIENLSFTYEGEEKKSLDNINLFLQEGECVLITGKSGCGKTTLLRVLNGLIPEFFSGNMEGEVDVCNMKIKKAKSYDIASIVGMMYQNPRSQFFNVDTKSELAFGIENLSYSREKMKERLQDTIINLELEDTLDKSIFNLSGGQKQKVAFGSIYAMNPKVFLMDEPSANLDYSKVHQLKKHMMGLKKRGKTLLICEHRIHYLKDIVDKVIYMENGKIQKVYEKEVFYGLTDTERKEMGLRALQDVIRQEANIQEYIARDEKKMVKKDIVSKEYIEIRDVSVGYQKKAIVKNLSYKIYKGDIVAITGRNGVGKTTFSEVLAGLEKPIQGKFYENGKVQKEKQRLKNSYMIMQDVEFQLFADSVWNECWYGQKNVDTKTIEEALKKMNVFAYREKHPLTLSGGQKQRLTLAVSLVCKKEILIFDEPTSGLDYENMLRVASLLNELASMGKYVFVVTHDRELIEHVCNKEMNMDKYAVHIDEKSLGKVTTYE